MAHAARPKPTSGTPTRLAIFLLALALFAVLPGTRPAAAQDSGRLRVAVKAAPPFAMKTPAGDWEGLAVELWRGIATETGLRFDFVETDLKELIDGVAEGRYAAGVGALTITPEREARLDFTHSFHSTGLAIAARNSGSGFWRILGNLASGRFLFAIGLLFLILLAVGTLFWLFERRRNAKQFDSKPISGIGSGLWLAAVTMTTVGYGDKAPVSPAARVVAFVWMFSALIIISTFTGMIASSLTVNHLEGAVQGRADLGHVAVGSVPGTSSALWLTDQRIKFRPYKNVEAALKALADRQIDAVVYDAPLLKFLVKRDHGDRIGVLPEIFDRQEYGLALAPNSPHREKINLALLKITSGRGWQRLVFSHLGD